MDHEHGKNTERPVWGGNGADGGNKTRCINRPILQETLAGKLRY